ncbi:cytochrome P450 736A117-like [Humulus lupulus]|uniref:cytochrome P450 736A117-like n=1 Tax=Humulus lupulus TaxID=3486 RepID=UPI002B400FE2|nr:cytochrome P450 736A117-like [Humulus lupulus]XP_062116108.1 cytochrome P450 736A117-like [Humulus lupulus]
MLPMSETYYSISFIDFISHHPSPFTILLAALIFSVLVYKLWFSITTPKRNLPPSPPTLPIIGNLHQLIGLYTHRTLQSLSLRYGPVMLLRLGSVPVLVISSAAAAREIFKTNDHAFSNRIKSLTLEKLLYNYKDVGTAPYGEYWRQTRSLCVLHMLSKKRVLSYRAIREEESILMVEKIRNYSRNNHHGAVNLSDLFSRMTNNVVCRVALGRKYDEESDAKRSRRLLGELTELMGTFNIGDYIPKLAWLNRLNGLDGRIEKVAKEFDEFLEGVLHERMNINDNVIGNIEDQNALVDILLWIQRENLLGSPFDKTCVKAIILDMFGAGIETSFAVLEWAMTELLRHPNAMEKLQNEVRTAICSKKSNTSTTEDNDYVTEDDLEKMPYLKAVLKETLRLHPPIPILLPRLSTQDVKISGYDVVSGTQVFINAWAIGKDSATWEDEPEKFEPERFLFKNAEVDYKGHDFGLIPFGAGRRGCPGINFAMSINELALASVIHKFDWAFLTGEESSNHHMIETTGITKRRKFSLMAVPTEYCDQPGSIY